MKRILLILLAVMTVMPYAKALIVSIDGEGDVPAEGLSLLVTEGEEDLLTGDYTMTLRGNLLTSASQISVRIIRSASGLSDEFCCGSNCTAGNCQTEETKNFNVSGMSNWYVHYMPAANSDETIRYVFDDGDETREITVRYQYTTESIVESRESRVESGKILREGQVVIRSNDKEYNITGKQL